MCPCTEPVGTGIGAVALRMADYAVESHRYMKIFFIFILFYKV